jgi:hypothetical protein
VFLRTSSQHIAWSGTCVFSAEALLTVNTYVNSQNITHWCSKNPHTPQHFPFTTLMSQSKSAVSAHKNMAPVTFKAIINSNHYVQFFLTPFFGKFTEKKSKVTSWWTVPWSTEKTSHWLLPEELLSEWFITHGVLPLLIDLQIQH